MRFICETVGDCLILYFMLIFRFCVGDRFYLCENKILCEYDFEERMVFANMAYNPATLAQLKRHATHIPPAVCTYKNIKFKKQIILYPNKIKFIY